MSDGSGDIIIKGGSCELFFDHVAFVKDENDRKKRKHTSARIKRITITGDGPFKDFDFDSKDHPDEEGFKGTIRVFCK